ncbi:MAG: asparagine synthase (glutamine-hydrolyzing) [Pirellulaceae bacterium]|nr:asparagine synthase (glutamine-hydrolyzing) [Pirellulaceae bacterium]
MCGITGAVWSDSQLAVNTDLLGRMTDVLQHRGPDDRGRYERELQIQPPYETIPGVALGFRRLSIIDLQRGQQPMANEDGSVWVVFNGEIYNYEALRCRLEGAGHHFQTECDTEVIVHLYEDEGVDCFSHLNGMFSLAIWDKNQRRLVLGRDRLGQKPLVYRQEPGRLLFASELKSLLQVPGVPREIDPSAVDEYLTFQYIPHPNSIFRGIHKLPPGHCAVFEQDQLTVRPYWQPDFNHQQSLSEAQAVEQLRDTFESAIQLRMRSDVPLGAFLSGGVDSSLVAAIMQKNSSRPIQTFSIGFSIPEYDETSYARQVAEHLGTEHHEFQVTPDAMEVLPKLVWNYDEPFADSSAIPTWYVSRLTREHVTVALSGDGGDELFVGYPRYRAVALGSQLDRIKPLRALFGAKCWQALPTSARQKSRLRQLQRFSESVSKPFLRRYLDWVCIFNEARRGALYTDDFLSSLPGSDPIEFLSQAHARASQRDAVTAISLTDLVTYLPCDLMTKTDTASMAHALECRQPFLDYRVVELAAALPSAFKFRRGKGKRILHKAFGHLLPQAIWKRRKMGFGVPLDHWFRNELREITHDVLLGETATNRGFFRKETIATLIRQHEAKEFDHAYRLWALLIFELWLREWVD